MVEDGIGSFNESSWPRVELNVDWAARQSASSDTSELASRICLVQLMDLVFGPFLDYLEPYSSSSSLRYQATNSALLHDCCGAPHLSLHQKPPGLCCCRDMLRCRKVGHCLEHFRCRKVVCFVSFFGLVGMAFTVSSSCLQPFWGCRAPEDVKFLASLNCFGAFLPLWPPGASL